MYTGKAFLRLVADPDYLMPATLNARLPAYPVFNIFRMGAPFALEVDGRESLGQ
jgi:hypothetical protein